MKRFLGMALLLALLASPRDAQAQRYGRRSGPAMTPFGPVFNPGTSAEWKQAGGNPLVYQALMEQKIAAAQQKSMQQQAQALKKQQQAFDKWVKEQKVKKEKGKPVDPAYQQMLDQEAQAKAAIEARAAKAAAKKEKAKAKRTTSTTKAAGPAKSDDASKSGTVTKSGTAGAAKP